MSWVKIDDQFVDHPKVLQAGPLAGWLYVCGLCYSARYLTDGFIPHAAVSKLSLFPHSDATPEEMVGTLVGAGLWEETEGGYQIHDYLRYNPSRQEVEADRAAAKERMGRNRNAGRSPEVHPNFAGTSPEVQLPRTRTRTRTPSPSKKEGSSSYPPDALGISAGCPTDAPTTAGPTTTTPTTASTLSENWKPDGEIGTALALYLENFQLANPQQQRDLRDVEAECGREVAIEAVRWASRKGLNDTDKIWSAARRMKRDGIGPKAKSIDMDSISPDEYIALRMGKHP